MTLFKKHNLTLLTCFVILLQSSIASAALIDYELSFSSIDEMVVGESFDVDVYVDNLEGFELLFFGFDFLDQTSSNVRLNGFTTPEWIFADNINDVGGSADPDFIPESGDNVLLATLSFTTLAIGMETVSFLGEAPFSGAVFWDESLDGSMSGSFDVNVVAAKIPEPSTFLLMLAAGLAIMRVRSRIKT